MATQKITARTLKASKLEPGQRELMVRDSELKGFALRVYTGGASYVFNGRIAGKRKQVLIGDAHAMTAVEAREKAAELRVQFQQDIDPVAERKALRAAEARSAYTLEDAASSYFERYKAGKLTRQRGKAPRPASILSEQKDKGRMLDILGAETTVAEIDTARINTFGLALGERFAGTGQKRVFGVLRRVLDHAVKEGKLGANPARLVEAPLASVDRERFLTADELASVWKAAGDLGQFGQVVRFLLAMPVRASVARLLQHEWIDREARVLNLPASALGNKSGSAWQLPLTDAALELIGEPGTGLVFRGRNGGPVSLSSTAKARLDKESGVTGWTLHDARRTVQTLLGDHVDDLDEGAADLWLAHKRSGIKAVYQRSKRLRAMRRVADQWDSLLASITAEKTNVIPLMRG